MSSSIVRVLLGAAISGALLFACAPSVGDDVILAGDPPSPGAAFSSPDAGPNGADVSDREMLFCPSNKCPSPLLTCGSSTHICDVDPLTDGFNCGACGNVCAPYVERLGGGFACVNGGCVLVCDGLRADCDGILENGCETSLRTNDNCFACNDKCTSPATCKGGACLDCFPPEVLTECGCKDLGSDDKNCGACGVVCDEHPAGLDPAPANAYWGCSVGMCDRLKCDDRPKPDQQPSKWNDCNGDLNKPNSDGCEINLNVVDVNHCGACTVQCAAGEMCGVDVNAGEQELECLCKAGKVNCGSVGAQVFCSDLDGDPQNCGACGRKCPIGAGSAGHGEQVCRAGSCGVSCDLGWADCNGFAGDGCETNVNQDPANCGACGRGCNGGENQACVGGRCLVEDCEGGVPQ